MSVSEKYIATLGQKKTELEDYLKKSITELEFTEQASVPVIHDSQMGQPLPAQNALQYVLLGVGSVVTIFGVVSDKPGLAVFGVVTGAAGVAMLAKNNHAARSVSKPVAPDYHQVTRTVYSALSSIQKHLFDGWDSCTSSIKSQIKYDINKMDVSDDVKNRAIQSILNTSVIGISMLNVSQSLGEIEKKEDYAAYKQYLSTFERDCRKAIEKAFDEQVHIYNSLDSIL